MIFQSTSIAVLFLATAGMAQASALCDRLYDRLEDVSRPSMSGERLTDTGAITRQNIDLRRARIELRRLGCSSGSIVVIGGANEAACTDLSNQISGMEQTLDDLRRRLDRQLSGGQNDATRQRVLTAIRVNGCEAGDTPPDVYARDGLAEDAVIEASTGDRRMHRNILEDLPSISETDQETMMRGGIDTLAPLPQIQGTVRTVCVRTCDGAFFPISSNATPDDFARDTLTCERRCPGSETALYYHNLETEEADQMVSAATGTPYAALPTAFAYKTRDPGTPGVCGCNQPREARTQPSAPISPAVVDRTPEKPAQGSGTVPSAQAPPPARPYDPKKSPVRVVGPTFLPPQESAIDLQHPKGPGYQQLQTN